jgi:hypothetical protein
MTPTIRNPVLNFLCEMLNATTAMKSSTRTPFPALLMFRRKENKTIMLPKIDHRK